MVMSIIPYSNPFRTGNEGEAVQKCYDDGNVSSGPQITEFEEAFAEWAGGRHAVSTSSGTTALMLAYSVILNDVAFLPLHSYIATYQAADFIGLRYEANGYGGENSVRVSLLGVDNGQGTAIHDSCQYPLPHRKDTLATCYSFHGSKIITTGEGGMVVTNSPSVAEQIRSIRNHGFVGYWIYHGKGSNFRMANINAAIGLCQLPHLTSRLEVLNEITPQFSGEGRYRAMVHGDRETFAEAGIDTRPDYQWGTGKVMLPSYPEMTQSDIDRINEVIK